MYQVTVEDMGVRTNARCDVEPVRRHLKALARNLELVDTFQQIGKKSEEDFPVHIAWIRPARLGRFTANLTWSDLSDDISRSRFQPLNLTEMVAVLGCVTPQHVQHLLRVTNHENRAKCAGRNVTKLAMVPLGSIAKVGKDGSEHLICFPRDLKSHENPQLLRKESHVPSLWLFPVRPVVKR